MLIGLGLYTYALIGQYIGEAFGLARSTALVVRQVVDTDVMVDEVMDLYRSLSDEERDILMACEKTPLEDIVVHLELCLGMRVVEVIRLRRMDIHCSDVPEKCHVSVRGKGRGDGKWRTVPFHPLT
jgi:site-specific recombinase XerD